MQHIDKHIDTKINTKTSILSRPTYELVPVLPIHEVMHAINERGPSQWGLSMEGGRGPSAVKAYWQHFDHMAWSRAHPGLPCA
eukprot:7624216-Heterocapsa_arctica.AAC.1